MVIIQHTGWRLWMKNHGTIPEVKQGSAWGRRVSRCIHPPKLKTNLAKE
jgi:hypothetical protein